MPPLALVDDAARNYLPSPAHAKVTHAPFTRGSIHEANLKYTSSCTVRAGLITVYIVCVCFVCASCMLPRVNAVSLSVLLHSLSECRSRSAKVVDDIGTNQKRIYAYNATFCILLVNNSNEQLKILFFSRALELLPVFCSSGPSGVLGLKRRQGSKHRLVLKISILSPNSLKMGSFQLQMATHFPTRRLSDSFPITHNLWRKGQLSLSILVR